MFDYFDTPLEVRWKGHVLPYRVFSKDQRVSHTAIIENKRLGHALSIVKTQQDLKLATKVMTNSEKDGYKKRRRKIYGPDFDSKTREPARRRRLYNDIFALHSERHYRFAPTKPAGECGHGGKSRQRHRLWEEG